MRGDEREVVEAREYHLSESANFTKAYYYSFDQRRYKYILLSLRLYFVQCAFVARPRSGHHLTVAFALSLERGILSTSIYARA
jgi:hypothetical protein